MTTLRIGDEKSYTLCESNLHTLYWTPIQQLTHLASAGEELSTGDVFGTGTISTNVMTTASGPPHLVAGASTNLSTQATNSGGEKTGLGCIIERTLPHTKLAFAPSDLHDTFLKDGDEVVMEGWCRNKTTGQVVLGFGECRGKVLPAVLESKT